jgi:transposase-like protein
MGRIESTLTPAQERRARNAWSDLVSTEAAARETFEDRMIRLLSEGATIAAIARVIGVSRQALHKRLQGSGRPANSDVSPEGSAEPARV